MIATLTIIIIRELEIKANARKEEAKRMIDAAPGDNVTIVIYNTSTMVHKPTLRKKKRIRKIIIRIMNLKKIIKIPRMIIR